MIPSLLGPVILALAFGYLLGRIVGLSETFVVPPLRLVPDIRDKVPLVSIDSIENGEIIGTVHDTRLFLGNAYVLPTASGTFRVPADPLLTDIITIIVPEGARFVASKNGKRYYPVYSGAGERLTQKNRVYFQTEEEAEAAGFTRR